MQLVPGSPHNFNPTLDPGPWTPPPCPRRRPPARGSGRVGGSPPSSPPLPDLPLRPRSHRRPRLRPHITRAVGALRPGPSGAVPPRLLPLRLRLRLRASAPPPPPSPPLSRPPRPQVEPSSSPYPSPHGRTRHPPWSGRRGNGRTRPWVTAGTTSSPDPGPSGRSMASSWGPPARWGSMAMPMPMAMAMATGALPLADGASPWRSAAFCPTAPG